LMQLLIIYYHKLKKQFIIYFHCVFLAQFKAGLENENI
jgi:hypothetical protein